MTSGSHLTEPDTAAALQPQLPGGPEPTATSAVMTRPSPAAAEVNDMEQLVIAAPPWDGTFGALLRACRRRAWLSQAQLAAQAHVSERTVRSLEAGQVRSPRAETVRLLADALQLSEPERASWLAAAVGANHQRARPAAAGVNDQAHARGDAQSGRPPKARPWHGQQSRGPPVAPEGFQNEVVGLSQGEDLSVRCAAADGGRTVTADRAPVSRADSGGGTRGVGRLSSAQRRELARLRRENRMLSEDVDILKRAAAIFASAIR